jgi:hypothetical protein
MECNQCRIDDYDATLDNILVLLLIAVAVSISASLGSFICVVTSLSTQWILYQDDVYSLDGWMTVLLNKIISIENSLLIIFWENCSNDSSIDSASDIYRLMPILQLAPIHDLISCFSL